MSDSHIEFAQTSSGQLSLATLQAERAIYRTFCNYLFFVDRDKQYERACIECFKSDAKITYHMASGSALIFHGRNEFLDYLESHARPTTQMSAHVLGQSRIHWINGKPRISAYITAWHWLSANEEAGDLRPADRTTIGFAEDDFENVEGNWLISRRSVKPAAGLVAAGSAPPELPL